MRRVFVILLAVLAVVPAAAWAESDPEYPDRAKPWLKHAGVYEEPAPEGVEHYGFAIVDTNWHDPYDVTQPTRTNYVDEVAGFTDSNHMVAYSDREYVVERLQYMVSKDMKAILAVQGVLFNMNPPDPNEGETRTARLFVDYRERWARFVELNAAALDADHVRALYIMDEPYLNGITFEELSAASDLVAETFPDIPVAFVEGWSHLHELQVPVSTDWVGFDDYVANPHTDPTYAAELATLKSKLSRDDQRIMLIMWAHWGANQCCFRDIGIPPTPYTPLDMGWIAENYLTLARQEPKVVAIVGYMWAGGLGGELGARDMPETVKETYRRIGREILGR